MFVTTGKVGSTLAEPKYIHTTIHRGKYSYASRDGRSYMTTPVTVITWLPATESAQRKAVVRHHERVSRLIMRFRNWRAAYDDAGPLVTRRADGRQVVTFPGESIDLHRLRALLPAVPMLVQNDNGTVRIVTSDGTNYPIRSTDPRESRKVATELSELLTDRALLESMLPIENRDRVKYRGAWHKVHPRYNRQQANVLRELVAINRRIDYLQTQLRVLGSFVEDDNIRSRARMAAQAAWQREYRERLKYGDPAPDRAIVHPCDARFSWILCYCPHLTQKGK